MNIIWRLVIQILGETSWIVRKFYTPDYQDVECCNCTMPLAAFDARIESYPLILCVSCDSYTTVEEATAYLSKSEEGLK